MFFGQQAPVVFVHLQLQGHYKMKKMIKMDDFVLHVIEALPFHPKTSFFTVKLSTPRLSSCHYQFFLSL